MYRIFKHENEKIIHSNKGCIEHSNQWHTLHKRANEQTITKIKAIQVGWFIKWFKHDDIQLVISCMAKPKSQYVWLVPWYNFLKKQIHEMEYLSYIYIGFTWKNNTRNGTILFELPIPTPSSYLLKMELCSNCQEYT